MVAAVTEACHHVKEAKGRHFELKHIGREDNTLADWLCWVALEQQADQVGVEQVFPTLKEDSTPPLVLDLS